MLTLYNWRPNKVVWEANVSNSRQNYQIPVRFFAFSHISTSPCIALLVCIVRIIIVDTALLIRETINSSNLLSHRTTLHSYYSVHVPSRFRTGRLKSDIKLASNSRVKLSPFQLHSLGFTSKAVYSLS